MWKGDWTKIPMGMPGLETMMPVVYTEGVLKRRITLEQFVQKVSTAPARIMGLYPRKGSLDVGTDAGTPVTDDYPARGNEFNGKIKWVQIDLEPDDHSHMIDTDHMAHVRLVKQ